LVTLSGYVKDISGIKIPSANVSIWNPFGIIGHNLSYSTGDVGYYNIDKIPGGLFTLLANKTGYNGSTYPGFDISYNRVFNITLGLDACGADCNVSGVCRAACDGWNGCSFHDGTASSLCEGEAVGEVVDYSSSQQLVCCEGSPFSPEGVAAVGSTGAEDVSTVTRLVWYNGKFVRMVINVFD
jgi:hypothetical protein